MANLFSLVVFPALSLKERRKKVGSQRALGGVVVVGVSFWSRCCTQFTREKLECKLLELPPLCPDPRKKRTTFGE